MTDEHATNGRYVTHRAFAEWQERHAAAESRARQTLRNDFRTDLARMAADVKDLRTVVEAHDDILQQLRGARALMVGLGLTNVVAIAGLLWAVLR